MQSPFTVPPSGKEVNGSSLSYRIEIECESTQLLQVCSLRQPVSQVKDEGLFTQKNPRTPLKKSEKIQKIQGFFLRI